MSLIKPIMLAFLFSTTSAADIPETPAPEEQEDAKADSVPEAQPEIDVQPPVKPFGQEEEEQQPREPSKEAIAAQDMIDEALKKIDPDVKREGNLWQLALGENVAIVVTDPLAERMRIMVPISEAKDLDKDRLYRLMQANFDSALDARYAISRGILWGTFIHPLTNLDEKNFLSGLAQSITVVATYGSTFTSGAATYGGGDSNEILQDQLFEQIKELNEEKARNTV